MNCLAIFLSLMSVGSLGGPSHPLPLSLIPTTNYATVTGYQTTIFKPIIQPLQTPIIQPPLIQTILPPSLPLLLQQPQPIPQGPLPQQPQPQPQPQPPPSQFTPPLPAPVAPPQETQELGPAPPQVASDVSDTVEIENPELRSDKSPAYAAPPSAYPIYVSSTT